MPPPLPQPPCRPLTLRGRTLGDGRVPLLCAPLVGRDEAALQVELAAIAPKAPDLLEWRIDFFEGLPDAARTAAAAAALRAGSAGVPVILTRRSTREGGQPIGLGEDGVFARYAALAEAGWVDFIDWELSAGPEAFARAAALARRCGTPLIGSFHDFGGTPPAAEIVDRLLAIERAGADVAKVAVMPQSPRDVLTLLEATEEAQRRAAVPLITMSMGGLGAVSRLAGWVFGSAVSFVVGGQASAPGQWPIDELRTALQGLRRATS